MERSWQSIDLDRYLGYACGVKLTVLQLGNSDPVSGGNKSYKLKYDLLKARSLNKNTILTFGGAWSNHIAATARACSREGFQSVGIIRGEPVSNITLDRAKADGMQLFFTDRTSYRQKHESELAKQLCEGPDSPFLIPEGGSNEEGIRGCEEILADTEGKYDQVWAACGTGSTLAGMIRSHQIGVCIGVSVLRDQGATSAFINQHIPENSNVHWEVLSDYSFGGYAKKDAELERFVRDFTQATGIPVEPVYTGKLFYAIMDQIKTGVLKPGTRVLAVHTGGLQYLTS